MNFKMSGTSFFSAKRMRKSVNPASAANEHPSSCFLHAWRKEKPLVFHERIKQSEKKFGPLFSANSPGRPLGGKLFREGRPSSFGKNLSFPPANGEGFKIRPRLPILNRGWNEIKSMKTKAK
jgi:hypothetical protein